MRDGFSDSCNSFIRWCSSFVVVDIYFDWRSDLLHLFGEKQMLLRILHMMVFRHKFKREKLFLVSLTHVMVEKVLFFGQIFEMEN